MSQSKNNQRPDHRVATLIERNFITSNGELCVGGVAVSTLAKKYGTPLYIYDQGVLDEKLKTLRAALPERFRVFYSMKANPNPAIVAFFVNRGCGIEVASRGELLRALRADCPPTQTLFAGPGKTVTDLRCALEHQIGEIHVESTREADRLERLADAVGQTVRVAVRVNPEASAEGGAMRMGGRSTPFGVDEECLDQVVDHLESLPHLELVGVHLYAGTQILDAKIISSQYRKAVEIAARVARRLQRPLETVDFGGGLGIPYFESERQLDMQEYAQGLLQVMSAIDAEPMLAKAQLIVEPGRYLVGEAGVYLARVSDLKTSRGRDYVIVDGGMHHHLAASGNLGQTIKRNYPVALANKLGQIASQTYDVVGCLCTPLDVLARQTNLPEAAEGDLFCVFQSGAYARSASPLGFLSHARPPEVLVCNGQHQLISTEPTMRETTARPQLEWMQ